MDDLIIRFKIVNISKWLKDKFIKEFNINNPDKFKIIIR